MCIRDRLDGASTQEAVAQRAAALAADNGARLLFGHVIDSVPNLSLIHISCTVSGASYGYTMLWALLFATVATIIFQEMASRVGIVSGKGLGENIRDRIPNKALMWIAIVIVIIAIFVGNIAYETGNITGGILGIQAVLPDVPMIPIVIVLGVLAFIAMWIGSYKVVEVILTAIVVFMGCLLYTSRSKEALPEDLIFWVSYLGGEEATMAINFSRSASQIVGQYLSLIHI